MVSLISYEEWYNKGTSTEEMVLEPTGRYHRTPSDISLEEWTEVQGIGPKLAQRIVDAKPTNLEEIKEISGIRPKVFENIEAWLPKNVSTQKKTSCDDC